MSQKISHPELILLIEKLIDSLTAIQDDSGQFLQRLPDGRVIDTKGWAGWEKHLSRCIERWLQLSVYVLFAFTS